MGSNRKQNLCKNHGLERTYWKIIFEDSDQQVIGVIEDFHFDALYNPIEPLMFQMIEDNPALFICIR